ncbi:MAG: threonine-phosphate decarboxylase CobD [Acidaminococcales bacterium]|jgi:threonine-phosphate decarboxylase|nr:threonine-phosphate decarboxylase CobD [Acidaminococcales bacterium]
MDDGKFEHGGNIYQAARLTGKTPELDFSANINPLGLSDKVRRAIADNIAQVVHYPDPAAFELREAISLHYGVRPDALALGNGAAELIYLLCHVLRPARVFLPVPSFSEYERAALAVGARVEYFYLEAGDCFKINLEKLACALPPGALAFIGNPDNPAGNLLAQSGLRDFLALARAKGCFIAIDESFIDFLPQPDESTLRHFCAEYDNMAVIHSLTKFFAIPGLRLGFGVFSSALALRLQGAADRWNVNSLAQAAGKAALSDKAYITESRALVARLRENLTAALSAFPAIKVFPSSANFLLLDIRNTGLTAKRLSERLAGRGVLVRDCGNYPGLDGGYVRIAVRGQEENEKLITILGEFIGR